MIVLRDICVINKIVLERKFRCFIVRLFGLNVVFVIF